MQKLSFRRTLALPVRILGTRAKTVKQADTKRFPRCTGGDSRPRLSRRAKLDIPPSGYLEAKRLSNPAFLPPVSQVFSKPYARNEFQTPHRCHRSRSLRRLDCPPSSRTRRTGHPA